MQGLDKEVVTRLDQRPMSKANDCAANSNCAPENTATTDIWGAVLSGLCFIHCTLPPVLFFTSPMAAYYIYHPWVHPLLTIMIVPVGLFAFINGYREHKNLAVLGLGILGVSSVVGQAFINRNLALQIGPTLLVWLGSGILVAAHLLNLRLRRVQKLRSQH